MLRTTRQCSKRYHTRADVERDLDRGRGASQSISAHAERYLERAPLAALRFCDSASLALRDQLPKASGAEWNLGEPHLLLPKSKRVLDRLRE
jgi:hypothetical protein